MEKIYELPLVWKNRIKALEYSQYTDKLHVSPDGNNSDGHTWDSAYTTVQAALDAASTDANDCTLILVAPTATYYDINTTGNPTWTGNYEIIGLHKIWSAIRNEHASATSVMKFTGKVSLCNLAIYQVADEDGIIFTNSGWQLCRVGFHSTNITGAAKSLHLDGSGAISGLGRMDDIFFTGNVTRTTAIYINKSTWNTFSNAVIHNCLAGIQITDADSDSNHFDYIDIGDCAIGLDIDAGNEQHFNNISFHGNTTNVDDEVGDHIWDEITGDFPITIYPDDVTGTTIAANADADLYGTNTALRAAAAKPFRIVGVVGKPVVSQTHALRLSPDAGSTHFAHMIIESARGVASPAPVGTAYIFNKGVAISGSLMAETGGSDEMQVWLKVQEI